MTMPVRLFASAVCALFCYSCLVIVPHSRAAAQTSATAQIAEEVWKTGAKLGDLEGRVVRNEGVADALQKRVDVMEVEFSALKTTVEAGNRIMVGCLSGILLILGEKLMALILKGKQKGS